MPLPLLSNKSRIELPDFILYFADIPQYLKAELPINSSCVHGKKSKLFTSLHIEKAFLPISLRCAGKFTVPFKPLQLEKASSPIVVRLEAKVKLVKSPHP